MCLTSLPSFCLYNSLFFSQAATSKEAHAQLGHWPGARASLAQRARGAFILVSPTPSCGEGVIRPRSITIAPPPASPPVRVADAVTFAAAAAAPLA